MRKLNGKQWIGLRVILVDGFSNNVRRDDLALRLFNQSMVNVVKKDTLEELFNFVIGKIQEDDRLPELLDNAIELIQVAEHKQSLHQLKQELLASPLEQLDDPFQAFVLNRESILIDRTSLREGLRRLTETTATKRILVVDSKDSQGMDCAGKSYSRELITFIRTQDESFDSFYIDLSRMQPHPDLGVILVWQVGERIAKFLKLGFGENANGLTETQWVPDFCDRLAGQLREAQRVTWLVIDSFAKKPLSPGVYYLMEELAAQITNDNISMLRLVLLDYDKANDLKNVIQNKFHREQIAPVPEKELYTLFIRLYEARERRKGIDPMGSEISKNAIVQGATESVAQVLSHADPVAPRPIQNLDLRVLNPILIEECNKVIL